MSCLCQATTIQNKKKWKKKTCPGFCALNQMPFNGKTGNANANGNGIGFFIERGTRGEEEEEEI